MDIYDAINHVQLKQRVKDLHESLSRPQVMDDDTLGSPGYHSYPSRPQVVADEIALFKSFLTGILEDSYAGEMVARLVLDCMMQDEGHMHAKLSRMFRLINSEEEETELRKVEYSVGRDLVRVDYTRLLD